MAGVVALPGGVAQGLGAWQRPHWHRRILRPHDRNGSVLVRTRLSHCGGWPPRTSLKTRGPTQTCWRELLVWLEVAAELVGDLPHERDLVAEAFRCCHNVTPSMRVSAPITLPKPSDTPAYKPYKARGRPTCPEAEWETSKTSVSAQPPTGRRRSRHSFSSRPWGRSLGGGQHTMGRRMR